MDADDDPNLFENGTVAWLLFSLGMCNAISMSFGVGKPPTARQTSWARLRKHSYCLGLTGHHHPHTIQYDTIRYDTIRYDTIQYNTTSFISNIEHNNITPTIYSQHWDGWKGVDRRIFLSWSTPKVVHIRVGIRYHTNHARWVNRLQLIHLTRFNKMPQSMMFFISGL